MLEHVGRLWSVASARELPPFDPGGLLEAVEAWLPPVRAAGRARRPREPRRARRQPCSTACCAATRPRSAGCCHRARDAVTYSGVITAGGLETALQHARRMKLVGLGQVKLKVGFEDDVPRIQAVRETLGPSVSLRLDANGGWTIERAVQVLEATASCDVAAVEQPLPRGPVEELASLRRAMKRPARGRRVPRHSRRRRVARRGEGGRLLQRAGLEVRWAFALARIVAPGADGAGIGLQVGSQVGETAILSAAGRHLAAHLPEVAFVEGSYGTLLLTEDVSADAVRFGHRGEAPVLSGAGLGVRVLEDRLCASTPVRSWSSRRGRPRDPARQAVALAARQPASRPLRGGTAASRGGPGARPGEPRRREPRHRLRKGARLRGIRSPVEYARRASVRDYEALRPCVDRIVAGEDRVLTAATTVMFTTTSGTTNLPKLIPVTASWREQMSSLTRLWMLRAMEPPAPPSTDGLLPGEPGGGGLDATRTAVRRSHRGHLPTDPLDRPSPVLAPLRGLDPRRSRGPLFRDHAPRPRAEGLHRLHAQPHVADTAVGDRRRPLRGDHPRRPRRLAGHSDPGDAARQRLHPREGGRGDPGHESGRSRTARVSWPGS